jgi:hypothetical protein
MGMAAREKAEQAFDYIKQAEKLLSAIKANVK